MDPFGISMEKTIPKRREGLSVTIGNALATSTPFGCVARILERRTDSLRMHVYPLLGFSFYPDTCRMELAEEGVSTRIRLSLSTHRLFASLYAAHAIVGVALFLIDWTWGLLVNPERFLSSGWIWLALLVWPTALWWLMRRRAARRLRLFLENLVYLR